MPTAETDEVVEENNNVDSNEDVKGKAELIETKPSQDDDASADSPTPQDETNPAKAEPQDAPAAASVPAAVTAPTTHHNAPPGYYTANVIHQNVGVHEPKKKKRQYVKKIPNRPKRPLSAYNVFFKYERERLVRETMLKDNVDKDKVEELIAIRDKTKTGKRVHRKTHGAIPFAELGKLIASNWKSLPASERKKYEAEANADKERYAREMEENNKVMAASDAAHGGGPQVQNKRGGGGKRGKHNAYYEEEPMNVDPYRGGPHPPYYDPYFGYGRPPPPPGAMGSEGYGHPGYPSGPPPPPGPYPYYPPPPHEYASPYHPYYGYPPRPPPGAIPMQQTNPEDQPNSPQRWMPPQTLHGVEENQNPQAECAYQCEICNSAVFSTFKECAEHEEECAKTHNKKDEENTSGDEEVPDEVDSDVEDDKKTTVVLTEKEKEAELNSKILDGETSDPKE